MTFSSLVSARGNDGPHCLGIGAVDGQLYEIAIAPTLPAMAAGRGLLLMTATGSARLQAEILGSALAFQSPLLNDFFSALATDAEMAVGSSADPPVFTTTDQWIAEQPDYLLSSFFNCGTWDVLLALGLQFMNNIAFWSGCYGAITAGSGWPSGTAPSYLLITPDGSVFYGNYNLSGLGWTFAAGVLTWSAPTSTSPSNAPPVGGTITFGIYTPDAPGPNGYIGAYFTGTLNGTVQQPASGQPALPAFPALPSVQSVTCSATGTPLTPGDSATVTVTLGAPAPNNGVLASIYVSGVFNWLAYPDTVLIPAGQSTAQFTITFWYPFPDGPNATWTNFMCVAAAGGAVYLGIMVGPSTQNTGGSEAAASTASLSANPSTLVGSGSVTLTLTLTPAPTSDAVYILVSNPRPQSGSTTLTVKAGQTSGNTTLQYSAPPQGGNNINAQVSATGFFLSYASTSFSIESASSSIAVQSVMFDPPAVMGGGELTMTVTLTSVSAVAETVSFTSSNTGAIPQPPSLTIPAFTLAMSQTITSKSVTALKIVQIGASLSGTNPATANVNVYPTPVVAELTINPEVVQNVQSITATLNFSAPAPAAATFTLTSSDTNVANPNPATASVSLGAKNATWSVTINAPQTPETVTLQAFAQNQPTPADAYAFTAQPNTGPSTEAIFGYIFGTISSVGAITGFFYWLYKKEYLQKGYRWISRLSLPNRVRAWRNVRGGGQVLESTPQVTPQQVESGAMQTLPEVPGPT